MFDQLRKAFSNATKNIVQKEITEKDLDKNLSDLELELLESDIAHEVIDDLFAKMKEELLGLRLEKGQSAENIVRSKFQNVIAEMFLKAGKINLVQKIKEKKENKTGPFVIAFLGINGTGKTTTVAKVAHLLRMNGISVVLAAADTHRAGAIEQLSQHAEKLSLKVIAQRYGADPSAVGRDAVHFGRKHYIDAILIDTAGRMQTSKNLMDEIGKIVRVVKPDIKLFVGDALAGNDTVNQARDFFQYTNFDGAVLTKIDADAKGGAAISIVHITSKPIIYLGVGQRYDDIIPFDPNKYLESIFGNISTIDVQNLVSSISSADTNLATAFPKSSTNSELGDEEEGKEVQELPVPISTNREINESNIPTKKEELQVRAKPSVPSSSTSVELSQASDTSEQTLPVSTTQENLTKKEGEQILEEKKEEYNIHPLEENSVKHSMATSVSTTSSPSSPIVEKDNDYKISEIQKEKKRKSRFGGLFSRWSKDKKEDQKGSQQQKITKLPEPSVESHENEMVQAKDSKKKHKGEDYEEAKSQQKEKHDVVYLSDEDIEDLFK
jgi:fused signal recognition particle receptor